MATKKRLIDAIALLRKKYEIYEMGDPEELFSQDFIHKVVSVEDVKNAPTVDAEEVVHGQWKAHKPDCRGYTNGFVCSCCGDIVYADYSMKECIYNYCPNCGARMDLEG